MSLPISEMWRPIPGYEGYYEVSDLGRVRSVDRTTIDRNGRRMAWTGRLLALTPATIDGDYTRLTVKLARDGGSATRSVHPLVMLAFVGPRPDGQDVCHNNGDATDNRLANLRYDTKSANEMDKVRHGTHQATKKTSCPIGHLLVTENLSPSALRRGRRNCLACERARRNVYYAKRAGQPYDFAVLADSHYARIMENSCSH